jgi:outer membrane lipoprotein SlyB
MRELTDMELNAVCGGANSISGANNGGVNQQAIVGSVGNFFVSISGANNGGINQQAIVGSVGNFFASISGANNGGVNQQAIVANAFAFR